MLGPMGSAVANPAFVPISKAFGLSVVEATYGEHRKPLDFVKLIVVVSNQN